MRIPSLAAAVLLTTTILSGPARAEPVSMFLSGVWTGITTGAAVGAGITGAFAAGMNAGSWLVGGSFAARLVTSIGLSALSMALAPKPKMPDASEVKANYAQAVAWQERVYGRVRKGGPFCLAAYSSDPMQTPTGSDGRRWRHYGILIAAHSTVGPVTHYLDKWEVEIDEDGWVTTAPINVDDRWYHGQIRPYAGQAGQEADPVWRAAFPEVGVADDFAGLSYAAIAAGRPGGSDFQKIYPGNREWVYAPVWDGCDTIYDPRSDAHGWSNNAALVIADVALWYGKEVDWAEVATEAAICDAIVTNRAGGAQKRWTINTVLRSNMTWEEARAHLMMCCDAWFYERPDGKLGFKVGAYSAPTLTLTDRDFLALQVKHKAVGPDEVGSFALRYVEPSRDYDAEVSGAVVLNPLGDRSEEECLGIDSHNQAWRVIYRWAKTAQPEWQISATLKPVGYELIGHRFVRLQLTELGLDCVAEVSMLSRIAGGHQWQLDAVSVEAGDFAPDALTLEPAPTLRAAIAEDGAVAVPASLTGTVIPDTGGLAMISYVWPGQTSDLRQQIRYRATAAGIPDWQFLDAGEGQSSLVLRGLVDGAVYEAQLRNRTAAGRSSVWAPTTPLAVVALANSVPPATMAYFTAVVAGSSVGLAFIPPNDPVYAAARIYRATGSVTFADAVLVQTEFGAPNFADEWTDPAPGVGSHSYWIEPINGSGIAGPRSGPQTVTII